MSKDKQPNKPISEQELLDYLDGKIKGVEANQIERQLLSSAFEEEAFQGLSEHSTEDIKEDLTNLKDRLQRKQIYQKPDIMSIAATVAFLITAFGSIWFVVNNALPSHELSMKMAVDSVAEEAIAGADTLTIPSSDQTSIEPLAAIESDTEESQDDDISIDEGEEEEELAAVPEEEPEDADINAGAEVLAFNEEDDEAFEPEAISEEVAVAAEPVGEDRISRTTSDLPATDQAKKSLAAASQARAAISTEEEVVSITGTVYYREDGEPLPGVQVSVDGKRSVSGLNGQFELTGVGTGSTLNFSGQGLVSKEVSIENTEPVNVVLVPEPTNQKAVIIGYDNIVNKSPEPVNGRNAFRDYVSNSLQYPAEASSQQIEGVVLLKLTVSSDGSINNIEVKKSLSVSCDQEAVRLIEEGPQWSPATYNGEPVEGSVRVRIIFDL